MGSRERASDAAAKSAVTQGLKTEKVMYADAQEYSADPTALNGEEPSITFESWSGHAALADAPITDVKGKVYIREASGTVLTLVTRSASGTCFWTRELPGQQTEYAKNDCTSDP